MLYEVITDGRFHVPQRRGDDRVRVLRLGVDHVADRQLAFFLGRVADAEALRVHHVDALVDHREAGFLGLGWIEPAVDEADGKLNLRIGFV